MCVGVIPRGLTIGVPIQDFHVHGGAGVDDPARLGDFSKDLLSQFPKPSAPSLLRRLPLEFRPPAFEGMLANVFLPHVSARLPQLPVDDEIAGIMRAPK